MKRMSKIKGILVVLIAFSLVWATSVTVFAEGEAPVQTEPKDQQDEMVLLEEGDDPDDPEPGEGPLEQTITAEDITAVFGDPARPIGASTDGDGTLSYEVTAGNDVVMAFSNGNFRPTKVGVATITITASGTEAYLPATKDITVTVEPKQLSNNMLEKPDDVSEATGEEFRPDIAVYDGREKLVLNVDYELSYENNVLPGTAVVIATGIGNYTGIAETTFTILEKMSKYKQKEQMLRIAGKDRFETSFAIADFVKSVREDQQYNCAIVANSQNFADALSGTYLSYKKTAPILLVKPGHQTSINNVVQYIRQNVRPGVTVYLLGGEAVVPSQVEEELQGEYRVRRLYGKSRYETNIEILKEAGVKGSENVLICDGRNFPDALSASATGMPILLVAPSLNDAQIDYLKGIKDYGLKPIAIGGTAVVTDDVLGEVEEFLGTGERVYGKNRFRTAVMVARKFFAKEYNGSGSYYNEGLVASGISFPDGLCGGLVAKATGLPLFLTGGSMKSDYEIIKSYNNLDHIMMLGGEGAVKTASAIRLLQLSLTEVMAMFPEVEDYLRNLFPGWECSFERVVYEEIDYTYVLDYRLATEAEKEYFKAKMDEEFPYDEARRVLHQVKEELGLRWLYFDFIIRDSGLYPVWHHTMWEYWDKY